MRFWPKRTSRQVGVVFLGLVLLFFIFVGAAVAYQLRQLTPADLVESTAVRQIVAQQAGERAATLFDLVPRLGGFEEPMTYLLLFLNNTEMRPGGGFIGSYAVVTVDAGTATIHVIEGTERLDARTPSAWQPEAPDVIEDRLFVDRWFFRDSNWSPDFAISAQQGLQLYAGEGGVLADEIDAVVGVTTHVLEDMLALTGPVTVDGITFTADNVVETLQYEVEYAYTDRGIEKADRKAIMEPLFREILQHLQARVVRQPKTLVDLATRLIDEKHVMVYSRDTSFQSALREAQMTGEQSDVPAGVDYVQWVDANLAALKTDHALNRSVSYSFAPTDGGIEATVTMTYKHTGTFDWRTSRYLSFSRVYTPAGSRLVAVSGDAVDGEVVQGSEGDKQWFGVPIRVEPGTTRSVAITYRLPDAIVSAIRGGRYQLLAQKQLGAATQQLTLDLEFGTTILSASPGEPEEVWGDARYQYTGSLRQDQQFRVQMAPVE